MKDEYQLFFIKGRASAMFRLTTLRISLMIASFCLSSIFVSLRSNVVFSGFFSCFGAAAAAAAAAACKRRDDQR